jgi:hypothetical protein
MPANSTHTAVVRTRVEAIMGFLLDGAGIEYELREHASVTSAAAEAHVAGIPPEQVAKTVVLHDGNAYVVVAVAATDRLDLHKLRELLGATRQLRLASEAEIARDFPTLEVGAAPAVRADGPGSRGDRPLSSHARADPLFGWRSPPLGPDRPSRRRAHHHRADRRHPRGLSVRRNRRHLRTPPERIEWICLDAWRMSLKAISVYREGSKIGQPL